MDYYPNLSVPEHQIHNLITYLVPMINKYPKSNQNPSCHRWIYLCLLIEKRLWALRSTNKQHLLKLFHEAGLQTLGIGSLERLERLLNASTPWEENVEPGIPYKKSRIENLCKFLSYVLNAPLLSFYIELLKKVNITSFQALGKALNIDIQGDIQFPVFTEPFSRNPVELTVFDPDKGTVSAFIKDSIWNQSFLFPNPGIPSKNTNDFHLPLFNLDLIKNNPNALVFLSDDMIQAESLEREVDSQIQKHCRTEICSSLEHWKQIVIRTIEWENQIRNARFEAQKTFQTPFRMETPPCLCVPEIRFDFDDALEKVRHINYSPSINLVKTDCIWTSYFGGAPDFIPLTDWSVLAEHPIVYVFQGPASEPDVLERFLKYHEILSRQTSDIFYVHIPAIIDVHNPENNGIRVYRSGEMLLAAHDSNIVVPEEFNEELALQMQKQKKSRPDPDGFYIDNILDRRSIMMITAPPGCGKSLLAMTMAYAATLKGKLLNGWEVRQKCKVLYIGDMEMQNRILEQRRDLFSRMFATDSTEFPFAYEQVEEMDLLKRECQEKVETMLASTAVKYDTPGRPVNILILDSLNKLAPDAYHDKCWASFHKWLVSLIKKDIAVILVHHTDKEGDQYLGTSKILNDIDSYVSMEPNEEVNIPDHTPIWLQIRKNRRGSLDRRKKKFALCWGKNPRWIEGDIVQRNWRALTLKEKIQTLNRLRLEEHLSNQAIAEMFNVSKKNIEMFVFKHPEVQRVKEKTKGKYQLTSVPFSGGSGLS